MTFQFNIKKHKLFALSILLSLALVSIDQFTKTISLNNINKLTTVTNGVHNHIEVLPFLNVVLFFNKGISFGIFDNITFMPIVLTIVICIISLYIFYLLFRNNVKYKALYLSLIFGGAIGNLIDRFRYGAVVDFIDFHIKNWHFPAFNFADAIISIGVLLILIEELLLKNNKKQ